jgi:site-specific DNA recombinase
VSAQRLEGAVWDAISESLQQPQLLADEYRRRLSENAGAQPFAEDRKKLGIALKRVAAQEDRVTEAYVSEAMDLDRYKEEMEKLKSHRQELDRSQREIDQRQRQKQDTQKALAHLERFCHQVSKGLTSLTFDERQQLLRLVIERITVENGVARIDTLIPPDQDNLRNRYPEPVEGR